MSSIEHEITGAVKHKKEKIHLLFVILMRFLYQKYTVCWIETKHHMRLLSDRNIKERLFILPLFLTYHSSY